MTSQRVGQLSFADVRSCLASPLGLRLRTGPYTFAVRTHLPDVARSIHHLYAHHFALQDTASLMDFEVAVARPIGLRFPWRPQVSFWVDEQDPFNPLPGDQGFPLLEWGLNYCVYGHCHQHLTLHAAVLELGGRALILPAPSGSGKSTLCAGLLFRGWRLLSDELTLICPQQGNIIPLPRPVSLKNESIAVLKQFAPEVSFGSTVRETLKGVVAHFTPPIAAVDAATQRAQPGWVVIPKYVPGSPARLVPISRARGLMHLIENAFNFDIFGAEGFNLLSSVVDRSQCFHFEYSDLEEACELFRRLALGGQAPAAS